MQSRVSLQYRNEIYWFQFAVLQYLKLRYICRREIGFAQFSWLKYMDIIIGSGTLQFKVANIVNAPT